MYAGVVKLRGRNAFCELQLAPKTADEWKQSFASLPPCCKIFRYDVKTAEPSTCKQKMLSHPFRFKPLLGQPFKNVMGALVGDPERGEQDAHFATENDVILVHDGRVRQNCKLIGSHLWKPASKIKDMFPKRMGSLKLIYDNAEFLGGFATQRRAGPATVFGSASSIPEPVETLSVLVPRALKLPVRARQFVDVGGDSRDRAWLKLRMRPEAERCYSKVSETVLLQLASGSDEAEEFSSASGGEREEVQDDGKSYDIFAWEADEGQIRETFAMFDPCPATDPGKSFVVDLCAGFSAAMAAVREKRPYRGYVANELTRTVLLEGLLLQITLSIQSQSPGFVPARRTLTRAQSLGGDAVMPDPPQASAADAASPTKKSKASENDPDSEEALSESGADEP